MSGPLSGGAPSAPPVPSPNSPNCPPIITSGRSTYAATTSAPHGQAPVRMSSSANKSSKGDYDINVLTSELFSGQALGVLCNSERY